MSATAGVLVVGAGPAGIAAAVEAAEAGCPVTLVERDDRLGGILNQCVHDGFGLELFGESLTGPEYVHRLAGMLGEVCVEVLADTMVLRLDEGPAVRLVGPRGYRELRPDAVVMATGCRERSFGSLAVPGSRPAGIMTAGTAQRLVNLEGLAVGRRAVLLGSGDVGLIMARRLTLQGAEVACVVERLPYAGGLPRNVSQCLRDFGIELLLSHTVVETIGRRRLEAVAIAEVNASGVVVAETRRVVECDTLLVSVGLIPENELLRDTGAEIDAGSRGPVVDQSLMTSLPGVFACGNCLHVHDLADWASLEGRTAGAAAAAWAAGARPVAGTVRVRAGMGVRYVAPQVLSLGAPAKMHFRVNEPMRRPVVRVTQDRHELLEHGLDHLAPAELSSIEIPALAAEGTLEVSVRER